jgi:hypothetical protein
VLLDAVIKQVQTSIADTVIKQVQTAIQDFKNKETIEDTKFVEEIEEELGPKAFDEDKKVYSVFRREGQKVFNSVLYIRKHLVELGKTLMKDFWKNQNIYQAYVTGSPGCGKTCFFYLWSRLRSVYEKKRVLIIQFRENQHSFIWIRNKDGTLKRMVKEISVMNILEITSQIIEKNRSTPFDLCIHDGVLSAQEICIKMLSLLNVSSSVIKKVIHVTSLAFNLSTGGQVLHHVNDTLVDMVQLSVDSWRLEEYNEAITCTKFTDKIKDMLVSGSDDVPNSDDGDGKKPPSLTDIVEAKYYYAGGSARFMFEYTIPQLKQMLGNLCNRVGENAWEHFAKGSISSSSPAAVNTLMQQFDAKATPLSKYILFRAYEKCETDLVKSMKSVASQSSNPVLKGWVFELEQIDLIRLSLESPPEKKDYITNNTGLSFIPHSKSGFDEKQFEEGVSILETGGLVINCLKWNQGCFDVAFYQENTLVTIQFTVAKKHSLKPMYIRLLRDALLGRKISVDRVVHVGVTEEADFAFERSNSGTGRQVHSESPQFKIDVFHSLPLKKETVSSPVKPEFFEDNDSSKKFSIDMWKPQASQREPVDPIKTDQGVSSSSSDASNNEVLIEKVSSNSGKKRTTASGTEGDRSHSPSRPKKKRTLMSRCHGARQMTDAETNADD